MPQLCTSYNDTTCRKPLKRYMSHPPPYRQLSTFTTVRFFVINHFFDPKRSKFAEITLEIITRSARV